MFDVLTIGTATRDVFLLSPLFKVLRDVKHLQKLGFKTGEAECFALGSKIEVERTVFGVGGGATNSAVTFSRQGFRTAALVKLGADEAGEAVLKSLKKEKIVPIALKSASDGTGYSTILLTRGGERTILVYRGVSDDFKKEEIPWRKLKSKWAYIASGEIPLPLMKNIVSHLKNNGAKLAMNPSKFYLNLDKSKLKEIFSYLDVVIVNREEASYLTGIDYKNERGIFSKFDEFIQGIAVMTDGASGALVSDGRYIYRAGKFSEKKLVDRTGAGDAFGSGFVAGLMQENDINYALRLASANATSVVERIGTQAGILKKADFNEKRWKYLDLDIEPL